VVFLVLVVMAVAARAVHVAVFEFLGGRFAHAHDLDGEVQVLAGERMVAVAGTGERTAGDGGRVSVLVGASGSAADCADAGPPR
jgi:hypothetical protein